MGSLFPLFSFWTFEVCGSESLSVKIIPIILGDNLLPQQQQQPHHHPPRPGGRRLDGLVYEIKVVHFLLSKFMYIIQLLPSKGI